MVGKSELNTKIIDTTWCSLNTKTIQISIVACVIYFSVYIVLEPSPQAHSQLVIVARWKKLMKSKNISIAVSYYSLWVVLEPMPVSWRSQRWTQLPRPSPHTPETSPSLSWCPWRRSVSTTPALTTRSGNSLHYINTLQDIKFRN